jgi:GT2 family glycosyltransferase
VAEIKFPCVSIIIVNYNGLGVLEDCLNSVLKVNYPCFEVIVIDNGSNDNSVSVLENFKKQSKIRLTVIKNEHNLGFAQANNMGVGYSACKYLAFLNNDTVVDENWLGTLVDVLEKDESIGAVQSLLLTRDGLGVDSLGGIIDVLGTAKDRVTRFFKTQQTANYEPEQIFSACAAAMLVRKSVFQAVGKFDPHFFAYYEDVDLSWRIRLHGYSIILDRNSIVYHMRSQTSKKFRRQVFDYHLYKNQLAMLIKNYESKTFLQVMPLVTLLYFYRITNALKRKDGYLAIATLKAIFWNIKHLRYLLFEREHIQHSVRRVSDKEIEKMMHKLPLQLLRDN